MLTRFLTFPHSHLQEMKVDDLLLRIAIENLQAGVVWELLESVSWLCQEWACKILIGKDSQGKSHLDAAVSTRNQDIVDYLLFHRADAKDVGAGDLATAGITITDHQDLAKKWWYYCKYNWK